MEVLSTTLMLIHIVAGTLTLLSATIAIVSKLADSSHQWHVYSGRLFILGC